MAHMLIGLLSDTHIAVPGGIFPPQIKEALKGVDLILHAGDIWIPSVLDELESVAPIKAAWGDDDMEADLGDDDRMMSERSLHLEGVCIWLMHIKPRYGLIRPNQGAYYSRPNPEVLEDPPDVVIFGHTHTSIIEHYKDVLLVNPGSATLPHYLPKLGTVGLLTIESGKAEARLVPLE